jgi:proline iminopeptidase
MRALYPASEPRRAEFLEVGDGHAIYVEEAGNPTGIPVVFLHGGPGSSCKPSHRQFFDPARYRSVLFDQRGCGRSRPFGETRANTTQALVSDLELLRRWVGVEAWVLFGGSWGAALALAYAETHPSRVLAMVLRGTFLARQRDLDWFMHDGAARLLPRAWCDYMAATENIGTSIPALHRAVFGADRSHAERIVRAWAKWSGEVVMYAFDQTSGEPGEPLDQLFAKTQIELHYAFNRYFLDDNALLANISKLPRVPVHLIHGQRDITCAPEAAWAVHQAIPGSTLEILRTAGHLSGEAPVQDALLRAADAMADHLLGQA